MVGHRVGDAFEEVGEVEVHPPGTVVGVYTPSRCRAASTGANAVAAKSVRRARDPLAKRLAAFSQSSASTDASVLRTSGISSRRASTRSRSRAKRRHWRASASWGATAGGNAGTYTLVHGFPRQIHAR